MIQPVRMNNVKILDNEILHFQKNTISYLLSLEPKKFLYEFDKISGIDPGDVTGYAGWERSDKVNFRGHFFGHYVLALSQAILMVDDKVVREKLVSKLAASVNGLYDAQTNYAKLHPESAGYVSAFKEVALDEVEGKNIADEDKENVLVPWYDLHKILAGLLATYTNLKEQLPEISNKALTIAKRFGEYVYNRLIQLTDSDYMLKIEYGGMNDALYQLFEITLNAHFLTAAEYFDEVTLFESLAENKDILSGKHANTTIPKLIGALHRYVIFIDQDLQNKFLDTKQQTSLMMYYQAAKNFWDIVVNNHTYITGDNSQAEHFREPSALYHDAEELDGGQTCESCNAYNMLKLTRLLFTISGDKKYLDYYEKTYINTILASQNPETGMMTYFQPMAAGYTKVYNRPFTEFWCCTGTGIENFTKLSDSYYFKKNDQLYVNLYFSNELQITENNLAIKLRGNKQRNQFDLTVSKLDSHKPANPIQLYLRKPNWAGDDSALLHNGQKLESSVNTDGFWQISDLAHGDEVKINFAMNLNVVSAPDNKKYVALQYGPYVLAGCAESQIEQQNLDHSGGVLVRMAIRDDTFPRTITSEVVFSNWQEQVENEAQIDYASDNLIKVTLPNIAEDYNFIPYYQVYKSRYGVYFEWQKSGSREAKKRRMKLEQAKIIKENTIADLINFDNNYAEFTYQLVKDNSEVGDHWGHTYRMAHKNGSFGYIFDLQGNEDSNLELSFLLNNEDAGKQLKFRVNDNPADDKILSVSSDETVDEVGFYTKKFHINPKEPQLKLDFLSDGQTSPRIFEIKIMKQ